MEEIVTREQAELALCLLALGLPAAGLLVGLLLGAARKRIGAGLLGGALVGALGPLLWVMWRAYNAVVAHWGLDSVPGLLVNLALFGAVGLGLGVAVGRLLRRPDRRGGGRAASDTK